MTLPISGLTKITGFADPDGRGYRATLRKSQIKGYQIQTWQAPTYGADGFQDGWTAYRFAVMAVAGPMSPAVRVADFATQAEAVAYVTSDSLNLLT